MVEHSAVRPDVSLTENWLITSDNACIPYRRCGDGPSLLMLHGWSQSGAMFHHQIEALSKHFTVIAPDLRGHGEAPAPSGGVRMARLAQDIRELMGHLGIGRAHMLGWSMGVSVIWSFIDLFGTDAIDRLVLVDQPSSLMITPDMTKEEIADCGALFTYETLQDLSLSLTGDKGESVRANFIRGMVTPHIRDDLFDWIIEENAKTPLDLAAKLLVSHAIQDWRDVLPRIDRPTLVIGGNASHVTPRSQLFVQSQIPGSVYLEFSVLEGGAHFPFLEAPAIFNQRVAAFLQD